MGPFYTPWATFFAWLVSGAAVIFSIFWAIFIFKVKEKEDE